jgi:hypothetical protein
MVLSPNTRAVRWRLPWFGVYPTFPEMSMPGDAACRMTPGLSAKTIRSGNGIIALKDARTGIRNEIENS